MIIPDTQLRTNPKKMQEWKVNALNPSAVLSLSPGSFLPEDDPLIFPDLQNLSVNWAGEAKKGRYKKIIIVGIKILLLLLCLYLFICSLDFLSSAFRLLGGKAIGDVFHNSELLQNPLAGLMIGVLGTVVVQSSSTSTSIVVTMVAAELISVKTAIPIIMGANVGTSVTSTLVSLFQSNDNDQFRLAFAAATIHDMFNWMSVIVLLPLEVASGYLYHLTTAIVDSMNIQAGSNSEVQLLTVLTKPFTNLVIQLNKKIIENIATGDEKYRNQSLIKVWCQQEDGIQMNTSINGTRKMEKCASLFSHLGLDDIAAGGILLVISLAVLCLCLIFMVKILNSILSGRVASVIKTATNADLPGKLGFLTGYLYIFIGCGMTILVQSSSIFTSTLVPLAGVGIISLERMYPLTIGSNIGTTTTSILASMAASGSQLRSSVQIALCHLFFNLSGILLFYPVPFMRIPVPMARIMGEKTAKYRWLAIAYLLIAFLVVPGAIFALSMAGNAVLMAVTIPIIILLLMVVIVNILQHKTSPLLPEILQTWNWLPLWMHSLRPYDNVIGAMIDHCKCGHCHRVSAHQSEAVTDVTLKLTFPIVTTEENLGEYNSMSDSNDNVTVVLTEMKSKLPQDS